MKQVIPICLECPNALVQTDFFDKSKERAVGCRLLTRRQWLRGLRVDSPSAPEYQDACPLAKGL